MHRFFSRRLTAACATPLVAAVVASACSSWQRVGNDDTPDPQQQLTQLFNSNALYTRIGRFVSADRVPYIGSVAFLPGRGDSTLAVIGLSLENRAFAFERTTNGYGARARVEYQFDRSGAAPVIVGVDESIQVGTFAETMRTDESVLLQRHILLAPGDYTLTVRVRDVANSQVGTATQKVTAPAFTPGSVTAPVLAYEVRARGARSDSVAVVPNPRGAIAYGTDTLLVYFEGVGFNRPTDVPLEVRDERDSLVLRTTAHFTGTRDIESQIIRVKPDSAPLGQLQVTVGAGAAARRTSALVSFSGSWVVTNFDDLLSLLRYFGQDNRISAIRHAQGNERVELWKQFYHDTDPNQATPENEALEQYFGRIALANLRFRDEGIEGWRTDRGEALITLGEPDEASLVSSQQSLRYTRWYYADTRLELLFQDITGFGRYRMTPNSRADFERVKSRVQARNNR